MFVVQLIKLIWQTEHGFGIGIDPEGTMNFIRIFGGDLPPIMRDPSEQKIYFYELHLKPVVVCLTGKASG